MKFVLPLLLLLIIGLFIFLCDWAFKHILWRFVSPLTAVQIRWTVGILLWGTIGTAVFRGYEYTRYDLHVSHIDIASARVPEGFDGFRIAQISDLHLNTLDSVRGKAFLREAFDSIFAQEPDIIVFTGDLVTFSAEEAEPFSEELRYLASRRDIPVYSILGNHDYADYAATNDPKWRITDRQRLMQLQRRAGWHLLNNTHTMLHRGKDSLILAGVENIGEPPFSVYGHLDKALGGWQAADGCFTVLLSHNPTHWRNEVLPRTQIDLTLSGHTHAMQFAVLGWSPSAWKYKEWGGLYTENDRHLYVNTGLGTVGFPFRIGIGPEISVFTLKHRP